MTTLFVPYSAAADQVSIARNALKGLTQIQKVTAIAPPALQTLQRNGAVAIELKTATAKLALCWRVGAAAVKQAQP